MQVSSKNLFFYPCPRLCPGPSPGPSPGSSPGSSPSRKLFVKFCDYIDREHHEMFGHERFEAYQLSIQFLKLTLDLLEGIPPGYAVVKDQLKRAALSIPLNIAEGSGRKHIPDRNSYYTIARGSAMECAAICDVLSLLDADSTGTVRNAKLLLKSIVSILTSVCSK